jgi:hypothetical protein
VQAQDEHSAQALSVLLQTLARAGAVSRRRRPQLPSCLAGIVGYCSFHEFLTARQRNSLTEKGAVGNCEKHAPKVDSKSFGGQSQSFLEWRPQGTSSGDVIVLRQCQAWRRHRSARKKEFSRQVALPARDSSSGIATLWQGAV